MGAMMSMEQLIMPDELRRIMELKELERLRADRERSQSLEEQERRLRDLFHNRDIPEDIARVFSVWVRKAAEHGKREVVILKFPSAYCTDRGRAINNFDPDWPLTLTGLARKIHDYHQERLAPLGYRLHARILSYPDGMPGEVGLFVRW